MRRLIPILLVHVAANLIGIVDGGVYAWIVLSPVLGPEDRGICLLWAAGTTIASYVIVPPLCVWLLAPVVRALEARSHGVAVPPPLLERAARRALNAPSSMSRIAMILWLGAAGTLLPVGSLLRSEAAYALTIHIAMATVLTGGVAATFTFYSIEWYFRRAVLPVLLPEGRVSHVPGVRPVPIRFKMTMLLVTTCFLPVSVLTVTATLDMASTSGALFLGASFVLLGGLEVACICATVTIPVSRLADEARRVGAGDLAASADVVSGDEIGRLSESFNEMVHGLRRARFVQDTFGRYVSRQVLDEILNGKVSLGGELRTATVLFSDIRGFTALSERLPPAEVVRFLNRYLDLMVDVLVEHGGTIDKFIGDAIMASFGVPLSREDDALRAVRCAVAMLSRLEAWNVDRAAAGEPSVEIGIGLHTGEVLAGNIGSAKKMEYTVIGDTVNTSSRIEQLNKTLGTRLLVSAGTYDLVKDAVVARVLPPVEVKGKSLPVTVYEVTGLRPVES